MVTAASPFSVVGAEAVNSQQQQNKFNAQQQSRRRHFGPISSQEESLVKHILDGYNPCRFPRAKSVVHTRKPLASVNAHYHQEQCATGAIVSLTELRTISTAFNGILTSLDSIYGRTDYVIPTTSIQPASLSIGIMSSSQLESSSDAYNSYSFLLYNNLAISLAVLISAAVALSMIFWRPYLSQQPGPVRLHYQQQKPVISVTTNKKKRKSTANSVATRRNVISTTGIKYVHKEDVDCNTAVSTPSTTSTIKAPLVLLTLSQDSHLDPATHSLIVDKTGKNRRKQHKQSRNSPSASPTLQPHELKGIENRQVATTNAAAVRANTLTAVNSPSSQVVEPSNSVDRLTQFNENVQEENEEEDNPAEWITTKRRNNSANTLKKKKNAAQAKATTICNISSSVIASNDASKNRLYPTGSTEQSNFNRSQHSQNTNMEAKTENKPSIPIVGFSPHVECDSRQKTAGVKHTWSQVPNTAAKNNALIPPAFDQLSDIQSISLSFDSPALSLGAKRDSLGSFTHSTSGSTWNRKPSVSSSTSMQTTWLENVNEPEEHLTLTSLSVLSHSLKGCEAAIIEHRSLDVCQDDFKEVALLRVDNMKEADPCLASITPTDPSIESHASSQSKSSVLGKTVEGSTMRSRSLSVESSLCIHEEPNVSELPTAKLPVLITEQPKIPLSITVIPSNPSLNDTSAKSTSSTVDSTANNNLSSTGRKGYGTSSTRWCDIIDDDDDDDGDEDFDLLNGFDDSTMAMRNSQEASGKDSYENQDHKQSRPQISCLSFHKNLFGGDQGLNGYQRRQSGSLRTRSFIGTRWNSDFHGTDHRQEAMSARHSGDKRMSQGTLRRGQEDFYFDKKPFYDEVNRHNNKKQFQEEFSPSYNQERRTNSFTTSPIDYTGRSRFTSQRGHQRGANQNLAWHPVSQTNRLSQVDGRSAYDSKHKIAESHNRFRVDEITSSCAFNSPRAVSKTVSPCDGQYSENHQVQEYSNGNQISVNHAKVCAAAENSNWRSSAN